MGKKGATTFEPCLIEVAVPLPVDRLFIYSVPVNLSPKIEVGLRVLAPFGRRLLSAFVLNKSIKSKPEYQIKDIIDIIDDSPLFPQEMIPFFSWIADYYFFPIGEVITHALPAGLKIHDRTALYITESGRQASLNDQLPLKEQRLLERLLKQAPRPYIPPIKDRNLFSSRLVNQLIQKGWVEKKKQLAPQKATLQTITKIRLSPESCQEGKLSQSRKKIIDFLLENGETALKELKSVGQNAPALARKMEKDGQVEFYQERIFRDPFGDPIPRDSAPSLMPEQLVAIAQIKSTLGKKYQTYLLSGVTGSGKTEIYLHLAQHAVSEGYGVLILVPEIALINQMERRFRARFGRQVAILHSNLSMGERYDQWQQMSSGSLTICIGVRSSVFAPLTNLGLIVVDEEHDPSYKQEDRLRYNARDLAVLRGHQSQATVVLGSATPSIQSYYNVKQGKFIEITLQHRVKNRPLPQIEVVNLTEDKELTGNRRFITPPLYRAMQAALDREEQVLLFLNRRGFANFPICRNCGDAFKCKNCDISMTLHKSINGFKCHLCGYTCAATTPCAHCGSSQIHPLGLGTEKVEKAVQKLFPGANVARMDRDTTTRKGALLKILKDLRDGKIQVLVGTQMVAKGHDFPNITLVGIICADLSLSIPDFRAGERTFQLLAQVAGRTGRGKTPGRVILQSYQPEHFTIRAAEKQNFREFYAQEIPFRRALNYPPYSRLVQIRFLGPDKDRVASQARLIADTCRRLQNDYSVFKSQLEILGPVEAPIFRIARQYRFQMILKSKQIKILQRFINTLFQDKEKMRSTGGVRTDIDVDPYFMS